MYSGWLDLADSEQTPLRVLATTAPIPCDAIAHRPGMATGLVDASPRRWSRSRTTAKAAPSCEEVFHTTGMVRADLRIYDAVREAMQRVAKRG